MFKISVQLKDISVQLDCVIEIQADAKEIEEYIVELTKLKAAKMNQLKAKSEEIKENMPELAEKLKAGKAGKP